MELYKSLTIELALLRPLKMCANVGVKYVFLMQGYWH